MGKKQKSKSDILFKEFKALEKDVHKATTKLHKAKVAYEKLIVKLNKSLAIAIEKRDKKNKKYQDQLLKDNMTKDKKNYRFATPKESAKFKAEEKKLIKKADKAEKAEKKAGKKTNPPRAFAVGSINTPVAAAPTPIVPPVTTPQPQQS